MSICHCHMQPTEDGKEHAERPQRLTTMLQKLGLGSITFNRFPWARHSVPTRKEVAAGRNETKHHCHWMHSQEHAQANPGGNDLQGRPSAPPPNIVLSHCSP